MIAKRRPWRRRGHGEEWVAGGKITDPTLIPVNMVKERVVVVACTSKAKEEIKREEMKVETGRNGGDGKWRRRLPHLGFHTF